LKGVVVAEGDTYQEALEDIKSVIQFHIEIFGMDVLTTNETQVLEAFIAEAGVTI
jgi:predicted RNase H-like HicB family nuclease